VNAGDGVAGQLARLPHRIRPHRSADSSETAVRHDNRVRGGGGLLGW
jgi:hypothetical protein